MPDAAPDDEDDFAAAELALRLPDDEAEVAVLRARVADDPAFAARVGRWDTRLTALFDEIAPVAPPAGLWDRLRVRIGDPVEALRRRMRRWQWATGVSSALAAGLAILLALPAPPPPVVTPEPAVVPQLAVAQLSDDRGTPLLAVGIERRTGLVRVRLQDLPNEARVPELWIIPAGGAPRSLGLIAADGGIALTLPDDLRGDAAAGRATLAVSMERADGAPHAAPAGPIVATGALVTL